MPRTHLPRTMARAGIVAMLVVLLGTSLAACGQRGPLFLPDKENPDKRR